MTKLTKDKRYFLQRLVENFKIDQRLILAQNKEESFNRQIEDFLKKSTTVEMKSKLEELNIATDKCNKIKKELDYLLGQIGIDYVRIDGKLSFQTSYDTRKSIKEKLDKPEINWDKAASAILLKLEACDTEEQAKKVLRRITNISVEKLIDIPRASEHTVMPDLEDYIHVREKVIKQPIKYKKR